MMGVRQQQQQQQQQQQPSKLLIQGKGRNNNSTTTTTRTATLLSASSSRRQPQPQQPSPRPKWLTCFNVFVALSFLEAISLIAVSFGSQQLRFLGDPSWLVELAEEVFLLESSSMYFYNNNNNNNNNTGEPDDDWMGLEDTLAERKQKELDNNNTNELDDDHLLQAEEANQEQAFAADTAANDTSTTSTTSDPTTTTTISKTLDNYSTRPHISNTIPIPLIVGGSDGSGTRAFVDVLGKLGVPMLVDDRGTMDIHGQEMFRGGGWPPLVQMVLRELHTANYSLQDLSRNTSSVVMEQIRLLDTRLQQRAKKLHSMAQSHAIQHTLATGVYFGIKAPVSMLVLPLFLQQYSQFRFLHVIRDGRDVALSANQSPVQKFFRHYYAHPEHQIQPFEHFQEQPNLKTSTVTSKRNLMAMQLWNDWNTQVHDWEQQHADGKSFDYLVMRTEDLLDPDTKFQALVQLADFVGSTKSKQELCCMSRKAVVDMGQSGGGAGHRNRLGRFTSSASSPHVQRFSGMARAQRLEALRQYRANRNAAFAASAAKINNNNNDDVDKSNNIDNNNNNSSIATTRSQENTSPSRHGTISSDSRHRRFNAVRSGGSRVPLQRAYGQQQRQQGRVNHADGIGIPIFDQQFAKTAAATRAGSMTRSTTDTASLEKNTHGNKFHSSLSARTVTIASSPNTTTDEIRKQRYHDLARRIAKRAKDNILLQQPRRRRLSSVSISNSTSLADFRKEYLAWKSNFVRVRLNPAKYGEEAYSTGQQLLNKYTATLESLKSSEDSSTTTSATTTSRWYSSSSLSSSFNSRKQLERQMRTPMAHLSRMLEQIRHGKVKAVHERYGKWAQLLADRPEMSQLLHSQGAAGLARFGYEPQSDFMDFQESIFVCDATVVCEDD